MLIAYARLEQSGIEPLDSYSPPQKAENGSHWFFEDFRISLQYYFNSTDRSSGVGILAFGPNGNLWCETAVYCDQLNEFAGYCVAIDESLREAEKSRAKHVYIFIPNRNVVKILNTGNPFKDGPYAQVHRHVREQFSKFPKVTVIYRKTYPKNVRDRLNNEARLASVPPKFSISGRWSNQISLTYFNIVMTDQERKEFAEQYARICLSFMDDYLKEYEEDFGKEALQRLVKNIKEKKVEHLPPTKRTIHERRESVPLVVKSLPFKKLILCQNCNTKMELESATLEKPENKKQFVMRCYKCYATKTLSAKGGVLCYGKYPKKI